MAKDFERVLAEVQRNLAFYVRLQSNPKKALAPYQLTEDEQRALRDPELLQNVLHGGEEEFGITITIAGRTTGSTRPTSSRRTSLRQRFFAAAATRVRPRRRVRRRRRSAAAAGSAAAASAAAAVRPAAAAAARTATSAARTATSAPRTAATAARRRLRLPAAGTSARGACGREIGRAHEIDRARPDQMSPRPLTPRLDSRTDGGARVNKPRNDAGRVAVRHRHRRPRHRRHASAHARGRRRSSRRCNRTFVIESGYGIHRSTSRRCAQGHEPPRPLRERQEPAARPTGKMAAEVVTSALTRLRCAWPRTAIPWVYCYPTTLITHVAPLLDLHVEVFPGISSFDTLLVDIGTDIAFDGIQMYEATDLLLRRRPIQNDVTCVIWQATIVGDPTYPEGSGQGRAVQAAVEHLRSFYPADHEVTLVMTKTFPLLRSVVAGIPAR